MEACVAEKEYLLNLVLLPLNGRARNPPLPAWAPRHLKNITLRKDFRIPDGSLMCFRPSLGSQNGHQGRMASFSSKEISPVGVFCNFFLVEKSLFFSP